MSRCNSMHYCVMDKDILECGTMHEQLVYSIYLFGIESNGPDDSDTAPTFCLSSQPDVSFKSRAGSRETFTTTVSFNLSNLICLRASS